MCRSWEVGLSVIWLTIITKIETKSTILDFLGEIERTHNFSTILWLQNQGSEIRSNFQPIILHFDKPFLRFDETTTYSLKSHFNDNLLVLCHLTGDFENNLNILNALTKNLQQMRYVKIIFLVSDSEESENFLKKLFEFCWQAKMLHVVALYASFQETSIYYRYTPFPHFRLERLAFDVSQPHTIYPDRMRDFKGFVIRVVVAGYPPRIIIKSTIAKGQFKYAGPVGNLLNLMSEHMNLSYEFIKIGTRHDERRDGIHRVKFGEADMSTALLYSENTKNSSVGNSYPLEVSDLCIMMPLPADVPRSHFFVIIISLPVFIVTLATVVLISMLLSLALHRHGQKVYVSDIFLHDACLRGILVQSFAEVRRPIFLIRGIYVKICLLGLMLTTFYNAFFCTFVTDSPKEPFLLTMDDLLRADFKVMSSTAIITNLLKLDKDYFEKYESVFIKEPNETKFAMERDLLDTRYGFIASMEKWSVVQEQQKWFTKQLFHRPTSLCVLNTLPMTIPIAENSYFAPKLNKFLLQIQQMGFLEHWHKRMHYELVENKDMVLIDRSEKDYFKPMKVEDLKYIFMGMVFMLCLSSLIWLSELLIFHLRRPKINPL